MNKVVQSQKVQKIAGNVPPAVDGFTAAEHAIPVIDDNLAQAVEFSSAGDVSSPEEIKNIVEQAADKSPDAYAGWFDRMKGYVGEQVAADDLASQGHVIVWPDTANNPGWDLLVDGHPYNVKVGESAAMIQEHFEKYPDIGVITSPELADQAGAGHDVIALNTLSNDVIEQHTQNSLSAVTAGDFDLHLPLCTLVLSSLWELKRLAKGESGVLESAVSVGMDVGGVAVGSWAGAKGMTAVFYPVLGPVAPIAGGIGGAILGRYLARKIKPRFGRPTEGIFMQGSREEIAGDVMVHEGRALFRDARLRWHALTPAMQAFTSRLPEQFALFEKDPELREKREMYLKLALLLRDEIGLPVPLALSALHSLAGETDKRILEDGVPVNEEILEKVRQILLGFDVSYQRETGGSFRRVIKSYYLGGKKPKVRDDESLKDWKDLPKFIQEKFLGSDSQVFKLALYPSGR